MDQDFSSEKNILFNFFNQVYPITETDFEPLAKVMKKKKIKKGEILLNLGQIETKTSLVLKGFIHQYVIIEDNLFTIDFSLAGMSFNNFTSYMENSPSNQIQEAITDSEILYFEKEDIEKLLLKNHPFSYIYTKLFEQVHLEREKRSLLLQHKNASKKYELFLDTITKSKVFLEQVPQKLIANYLGITPETYSRVKKEYLKKR
ncbi:Crp/Fnr family transcriptional regulator [Zobellia galactanivorans]|uniref:Crp/Fnr-type transcriptional regulator n=1 Tax=Zobellia galactanivorans (strain DSM 12802 / CCUG 47099 / CIP 106680 / NCIMB 13871 / Dsij) TaxID=63186 RepID=G0L7G5_ZOBGA|nr:Crp/Fnr family transcriptional regulator [Zobellia galactanivorans]MBU3026057.1 Crp/Fnr family transcriptional regulator [Zobellia galactanivorans]CAZ97408.1 Crp/Fnr-type transcriptional regulator [Zobellia galactanivorans]